jgi:hypothetical protein
MMLLRNTGLEFHKNRKQVLNLQYGRSSVNVSINLLRNFCNANVTVRGRFIKKGKHFVKFIEISPKLHIISRHSAYCKHENRFSFQPYTLE